MKLLTTKDATELFHVHYNTLRNWEKAKIITPTRVGRKIFYTESAISKALGESSAPRP
jgi:DNA-binding transcriptional MerR regulator